MPQRFSLGCAPQLVALPGDTCTTGSPRTLRGDSRGDSCLVRVRGDSRGDSIFGPEAASSAGAPGATSAATRGVLCGPEPLGTGAGAAEPMEVVEPARPSSGIDGGPRDIPRACTG